MGRGMARRTLDLAAEQAFLDQQGIVHSVRTEADLDEAAHAYKDIEDVMALQAELVQVTRRLTPMAVIKAQ